jgi:hypothetical protein
MKRNQSARATPQLAVFILLSALCNLHLFPAIVQISTFAIAIWYPTQKASKLC